MSSIVTTEKFDAKQLNINERTGAISYKGERCLIKGATPVSLDQVKKLISDGGSGLNLRVSEQGLTKVLSTIVSVYMKDTVHPFEIQMQDEIDCKIFEKLLSEVPNVYSGCFVYEFLQILKDGDKHVLRVRLDLIDDVKILVRWDELDVEKLSFDNLSESRFPGVNYSLQKILYDGYPFVLAGKPETLCKKGMCKTIVKGADIAPKDICAFDVDDELRKTFEDICSKVSSLPNPYNSKFSDIKSLPIVWFPVKNPDSILKVPFKGTPYWYFHDVYMSSSLSKIRFELEDVKDITLI